MVARVVETILEYLGEAIAGFDGKVERPGILGHVLLVDAYSLVEDIDLVVQLTRGEQCFAFEHGIRGLG